MKKTLKSLDQRKLSENNNFLGYKISSLHMYVATSLFNLYLLQLLKYVPHFLPKVNIYQEIISNYKP